LPRSRSPAAEAVVVDLKAGDEEQEGQSEERHELDGRVDLDPAETRRADHDADHDLEDDGWKPEPRREAECERDREGDRGDDQEVVEADLGDTGTVPGHLRALRRPAAVTASDPRRLSQRTTPTPRRQHGRDGS
jgi:hypothetical protein